jgi:hypothetical protein
MRETVKRPIGPGTPMMVDPRAAMYRSRRDAIDLLLAPARLGTEWLGQLVGASLRTTHALWAAFLHTPSRSQEPDSSEADADQPSPPTGTVDVTFRVPAAVAAHSAHVCGEFNDWSTTADPMDPQVDGSFELTRALPVGRRWRFRYLLDSDRWENDWTADDYPPNAFGDHDSVVDLRTPSESRLVSGHRPPDG